MAMACSGSLVHTDTPVSYRSDAQSEGSAGHALMEYVCAGTEPDLSEIAHRYGIDLTTATRLMRMGVRAWERLSQHFIRPVTEVGMSVDVADGVTLSGHIDVHCTEAAIVADWKFGWRTDSHVDQLKGYAYLLWRSLGSPDREISVIEARVRLGEMRVDVFSPADLDRFAEDLVHQVRKADNSSQYAPSESTCRFCPRRNSCNARAEWISQTVRIMSGDLTGVSVYDTWDRVKALQGAIYEYMRVVDSCLDSGPIPLSDGRVLEMRSESTTYILPDAVPIIADSYPDVSSSSIYSVSKTSLARDIGSRNMRDLMSKLDAEGLVAHGNRRVKRVSSEKKSND